MSELARQVPGRDHVAVPAERKNLARPDEVIGLPDVVEEVVDLGELTVGRTISQPGRRWSTQDRGTDELKCVDWQWALSPLVA